MQGNYSALYLIPGPYRVGAAAKGFKRFVRDGIEVRINDRLEVNIVLELGAVTEEVTVTAETPLLETATASLGAVVDTRRLTELPMPHGEPYYLIGLSPGVGYMRDFKLDRPYEPGHVVGYSAAGARGNRNELLLDGISNTAGTSVAYVPPADAVSEFKVQTAVFDASAGQTEGGVVNVSLKSGTNNFHGTAYFVKMSPELTANTFFGNRSGQSRADFTYNRWGTMASGPVVLPKVYSGRNRTFYMYSYEGIHEARPRGTTATVPTEPQRRGDFSQTLALGARYQIYDPSTRTALAGGRFQSGPFPGNIIPSSRISPIAKKILGYYALPTHPGTVDGGNNLPLPNEPETVAYYNHTVRLDHNLSDRHRVFGRVSVYKRDSMYDDWFKSAATGQRYQGLSRGAGFDDVYTFGPTLVMNTRLGFARYGAKVDNDKKDPESRGGFDLTTLGLPAAYNNAIDPEIRRFPYIVMTNYTSTFNGLNFQPRETYTFANTLDKIHGSHSLKAGFEYRLYRMNGYNYGNISTGQLDFGNGWTQGPMDNSPAAPRGQSVAALLLGLPTGGYVRRAPSYAAQSTAWCLYAQDDWKVTRKLTVTLGLRYEVEGPLTERFNRSVTGFDYNTILPIEAAAKAKYALNPTPELSPDRFTARGSLMFAGVGGQPRTLWQRDTNNFMPRIGLAYQLTNNTVVRTGYGVFYGFLGSRRTNVDQTGFSRDTPLTPSLDGGLTFRATLANPFPDGILEPRGAALAPMTNVGQDVSFFNPKPLAPYMQRWQFSIQRGLPRRIVVDVAYVGNRGTKIETSRELNPFPVQYLSRTGVRNQPLIDYFSANLPSPYYPLLPGTSRSSTLISRGSLLTAYPHYTGLTTTTNEGYSWYHSLQVKIDKRFSGGLMFQSAYTWAKFMEATSFLNEGDPVPAKAISDQDFPHRVTFSWIYELPFGSGRKWIGQARSVPGKIVSGWQVQGIFTGQAGQALGFGNAIFYGDLKDIVLPKNQRTPERWFNIAAGFERDPQKQLSYAAQAMSPRFNGIRGDGLNNWDMSVIKDTRINETVKVQFRAEFLNAMNHAMFSNPNTTPTNSSFGMVTAEKAYPRRIQLGIKFIY